MKTKYIKKVLMCEPNYFSVEYQINPWMRVGSVNLPLAKVQWKNLVKIFCGLGINVEVLSQKKGLPDMVFAADQGIAKDNNFILSSFRYPQRQGETEHYLSWIKKYGFDVKRLPNRYFFEGGGDSVWCGEILFVGTGFRNSPGVGKFLSEILNVEVIDLELTNPNFYHLDTCLFAPNSKTAFYFPEAFSSSSRKILRSKFKYLFTIAKKEAINFAANSITTDHHVVAQSGNDMFKSRLEGIGYKVVETDVSEFMKSGGGVHCLVQTLEETYE